MASVTVKFSSWCAACLLVLGSIGHAAAQRGEGRRGGPPPFERPDGPPRGRHDGPPEGRHNGPPEGRRNGPPEGSAEFNLLISGIRFGDKPVKGAPYSAQALIESTQTLADGTRITRQVKANVYRDGEGRMRREQTIGFLGPFVPAGDPPQVIFISDPVADALFALDPNERVAHRTPFNRQAPPPEPELPPGTVTEALGKKVIEGVEAEGTRATTTIPVGQVGNDRPLKIVSERWYAPDLKIVMLSTHNDPRLGTHTYRLTNLKREEPARALFEVPADYHIEKGRDRNGPPRPEEQ